MTLVGDSRPKLFQPPSPTSFATRIAAAAVSYLVSLPRVTALHAVMLYGAGDALAKM